MKGILFQSVSESEVINKIEETCLDEVISCPWMLNSIMAMTESMQMHYLIKKTEKNRTKDTFFQREISYFLLMDVKRQHVLKVVCLAHWKIFENDRDYISNITAKGFVVNYEWIQDLHD